MNDDFDVSHCETVTAEEMFDKFDRDFKKENPIAYWVDNTLFKGKGFLGYAPHHSLTHPFVLLGDLWDQIRWAWQRVFRGWDDRVVWSIDSWLDRIMPDILQKLKEVQHGIPSIFFEGMPESTDEQGRIYNSDEQMKIAGDLWNIELNKMIAGFLASKQLVDLEYDYKDKNAEKDLKDIFDIGMKSFVTHYWNLWD